MTTAPFPATGHYYQVDGGGKAFEIAVPSDAEMVFAVPNNGVVETVHLTCKPIHEDVFLVSWQEADETTVVQSRMSARV